MVITVADSTAVKKLKGQRQISSAASGLRQTRHFYAQYCKERHCDILIIFSHRFLHTCQGKLLVKANPAYILLF